MEENSVHSLSLALKMEEGHSQEMQTMKSKKKGGGLSPGDSRKEDTADILILE